MAPKPRYRLKRHHPFEHGGRKYAADLDTGDIVQLNDAEWDILARYDTQSDAQLIEGLKEKHKVAALFEGLERLEQLGKAGQLLRPIEATVQEPAARQQQPHPKRQLLTPFQFAAEKTSLDYVTNLNRYQLLTHLAKVAEVETLTFSEAGKTARTPEDIQAFGDIRIRHIEVEAGDTFFSPWYALEGYDGILLLSQFLSNELLFYQGPDVPIVHCIEGAQTLQGTLLETLLTLSAFQRANDTLVVKASWMKTWLSEVGVPRERVRVIPDGIHVGDTLGKPLAKQHTAAIFDKPMFVQQPVVGLISGFEPSHGAKWISEFAHANPHLAIFVYDAILGHPYRHPPANVVVFSADDEETRTILPIFFQALDIVCFPAIPGTPLSLVLEAMAYGTACVAMATYGLPAEVKGAGVSVASAWDNFGRFHVPMAQLSATVNHWVQPGPARAECERVAKTLRSQYTWEHAAQELIGLFEEPRHPMLNGNPRTARPLFPSLFCRRYDPGTGQTMSCAYRLGSNRYEPLETALAELLAAQHQSAEVASVFTYLQQAASPSPSESVPAREGVPPHREARPPAGVSVPAVKRR